MGFFDKKSKGNDMSEEAQEEINGIRDIECSDGIVCIYLSGKIDAKNTDEIKEKAIELLEKEDTKEFVFNMSDVDYVSSAGLRMFAAINYKAAEVEKTYRLSKMRTNIMKLFQMTGHASAFHIDLKED